MNTNNYRVKQQPEVDIIDIIYGYYRYKVDGTPDSELRCHLDGTLATAYVESV